MNIKKMVKSNTIWSLSLKAKPEADIITQKEVANTPNIFVFTDSSRLWKLKSLINFSYISQVREIQLLVAKTSQAAELLANLLSIKSETDLFLNHCS